jgi:hypothetical protein
MVVNWGYRLILVFAEMDSPVAKLVAKGTMLSPTLMIQHNNTNPDQDEAIAQTLATLKQSVNVPVLAILPGAETGVELADRLAARFGTRNNGEEYTELAVLFIRLDEHLARSSSRLPVDVLNVVSWLVLTNIGEHESRAAKGGAILPEQIAGYEASRSQLNSTKLSRSGYGQV